MSRSPDLVAIAVDAETYLISLRTACDLLSEAYSHFCVEPKKRGQLPKETSSFREMIFWVRDNPQRVRERFRFITDHFDWFMELRAVRYRIVHQGYYSNIYTDRNFFKFFLMPGRPRAPAPRDNPPIRQVPLVSFLRRFTQSVLELAAQLSQAIDAQQGIRCSQTHVLEGVYVPALYDLLSYQMHRRTAVVSLVRGTCSRRATIRVQASAAIQTGSGGSSSCMFLSCSRLSLATFQNRNLPAKPLWTGSVYLVISNQISPS